MKTTDKKNIHKEETFCPATTLEWRKWLKVNHKVKENVWLIQYRKETGKATISWSEAVDEALCFGWIDGTRRTIDDERFTQFFSKRKPGSTWSKINKEKIVKLAEAGKMTPAGLEVIERAKQNGSWTILDEVEELTIPKELEAAFKNHKGSKEFFMSLSKSAKKMMLHRVALAKRDETKQKRVTEIVTSLTEKMNSK